MVSACQRHDILFALWLWARYSVAMKATALEPEMVTRRGKLISVILPVEDYEELLERAEDAADLAWLKRARSKPQHYRPLEDYLAERRGT